MNKHRPRKPLDFFIWTIEEKVFGVYLVLEEQRKKGLLDMRCLLFTSTGPPIKRRAGLRIKQAGREYLFTTAFTRMGLLTIAIWTTGAGCLSAFSPNYILLVILRFLAGIGMGGGPVYTSWFLEFVPAPNRGTWMVIFLTF